MGTIKIDADALFRAVTAAHFKLMVYHLDLDSGEVIARTLRPDEVPDAPQGPSVPALPKIGGDLTPKKDAAPFGPPPVTASKKLFSDDDLPKKPAFDSGFWKHEGKKRPEIFGEGGFRRESGTKKLAEMFGEKEPKKTADPFASPALRTAGVPSASVAQQAAQTALAVAPSGAPDGATTNDSLAARQPRIPVAGFEQQLEWVRAFAKDFGDPEIREEILHALKASKAMAGFERVLRKYQRMNQQWNVYFRKQALACAEAWLETLGVQWELVEPDSAR